MVLLVLLAMVVSVVSQETPTVTTSLGTAVGSSQRSSKGRTFYSFSGLPYAVSPTGPLRFMPPQQVKKWGSTRDATVEAPPCPHSDPFQDEAVVGEEDCLYLNVYTPQLPRGGLPPPLLPVIVFFHGGAYAWGTGNRRYHAPQHFMNHDVIFVTVNSRLGALGYLSTGDHVIQGNMGLKDQVESLRWVQRHIMDFGGDPSTVTIMGHVTGGSGVHLHMLSPLSRGLFHRAIMQSATALSPLAYSVNPRPFTLKLSLLLNCGWKNSKDLLECLQKVSVADILSNSGKFNEWYTAPFNVFLPCIEMGPGERFLSRPPAELLKNNETVGIPIMVGNTAQDGLLEIIGLINNTNLLHELNTQYQRLFPTIYYYRDRTSDIDSVSKEIRQFYFGDKDINRDTLEPLAKLYSDRLFHYSTYEAARLHALSGGIAYLYRLTYRGSNTFVKAFWGEDINLGPTLQDDMLYLFESDLFPRLRMQDDDFKMVDIMTTLWTNFARFGNPTPLKEFDYLSQWEPVNPYCMKYYNLNLDLGMKTDLPHKRMTFWRCLPLVENGDSLCHAHKWWTGKA